MLWLTLWKTKGQVSSMPVAVLWALWRDIKCHLRSAHERKRQIDSWLCQCHQASDRDSECQHSTVDMRWVLPHGPSFTLMIGGQGVPGPLGATGIWGPMPHLGGSTLKATQLTVHLPQWWLSREHVCLLSLKSQPEQSHSTWGTGHHRGREYSWHMEAKSIKCPEEHESLRQSGWSEAEGCLLSASLCLLL